MVYSPGTSDYRSSYQPAAPAGTENRSPRPLFIIVAVLGLASYGLSFGPAVDGGGTNGWNVRFAALAALGAAFALLPAQKPHRFAVAALAAMGFLDALSSSALTTNGGWPLTVIAVLNGVQAAAAVTALALQRGDTPAGYGGYEVYVDYYNQLARYYSAAQPPSASTPSAQQFGYAQHSGEHLAPAAGQVSAHEPTAAPAQSPAPFQRGDHTDPSGVDNAAMYGGFASSPDNHGGAFASSAGLPSAAPASAPAAAPGKGAYPVPQRPAP